MKVPSLTVVLDDILVGGLELTLELSPEEVVAMATSEGQQPPRVVSPLRGLMKVERQGQRLLLSGSFQVSVELICDRCLEPLAAVLDGVIDDSVALRMPTTPAQIDEEGDDELPVVNGRVDLGGLLAEFFWLAWPFRSLCRPDCAGLCPRCGADLNHGSCGCALE